MLSIRNQCICYLNSNSVLNGAHCTLVTISRIAYHLTICNLFLDRLKELYQIKLGLQWSNLT